MVRPVFRPDAALPVGAVKTYQILQPTATHFRPATCEEVECANHVNGWKTIVPVRSDLADAVRSSGRVFTEEVIDGGLVEFRFKPGQQCFRAASHRISLQRDQLFMVRRGDWRGFEGPALQHRSAADWVDDFASHQDRLNTKIGRG